MDGTHRPPRRFRFTLRALCASILAASLVAGFAVQQVRIYRLTEELSEANKQTPVMLFHVPGGASERPRIAGYVGGPFIELTEPLNITGQKSRLSVTADATGLVADVNGRTVRCKTLTLDQKTGRLVVNESHFFERLGIDYDFPP